MFTELTEHTGRKEKEEMGEWKKAWGYLPANWGTEIGTVENTTQKLWLRNNLNGKEVRVKFSNLYDTQPYVMEHGFVRSDLSGKQ